MKNPASDGWAALFIKNTRALCDPRARAVLLWQARKQVACRPRRHAKKKYQRFEPLSQHQPGRKRCQSDAKSNTHKSAYYEDVPESKAASGAQHHIQNERSTNPASTVSPELFSGRVRPTGVLRLSHQLEELALPHCQLPDSLFKTPMLSRDPGPSWRLQFFNLDIQPQRGAGYMPFSLVSAAPLCVLNGLSGSSQNLLQMSSLSYSFLLRPTEIVTTPLTASSFVWQRNTTAQHTVEIHTIP
ncbi:hypothetical protein C8R43DRAFT_1146515 [Mycena crocata]|nr:hypothetical protein C8R43DRAFT_1146515 [Mycena crocata]